MRTVEHFIGGNAAGGGSRQHDIWDPNSGEVQAKVSLGAGEELQKAVDAALAAQPAWAATNPQKRAQVMFEYKRLVESHMDELAALLSSEHGKVLADAAGDLQRGLDVIEFCCGIPHALKGEYTQGAGPGIDVYSMRQPLGICAGITPFNFPAMIPMWMFGVSIACGNAFILKPSERDPSVPVRLAELMKEAGLPDGILNVVHGDKQMVDAILDHDEIKAVSFVGSTDIAHYVYQRGTENGKRVQAMGGAKNHGIVMPDADLDQVVNDLAGAAFGSAGQRCMALPVVVPVGNDTADALREKMIPAIDALRVGVSTDPDAHYGPVVTKEHKERVENWIQTGVDEGAELVVDGRGFSLQGHENGFFVGPSLFDHVKPGMESYRQEIFGPVLQIVRANEFEEALALASNHQYGNGVAIFTRNGHAAREFAHRVNVGMVGINVPIPVPVAYHTFGGWKNSAFGDTNQHGMEGVKFWTKIKTVTQRWPDGGGDGNNAFVIPTMGEAVTVLPRLALLPCAMFAASAMAQPSGDAGAALPPPGELAFAIPEQFHGRWLSAEAGCAIEPVSTATIISAEGLQRGDHWSEPVELIGQTGDGRQLAMRVDLYFQAPPVLHRSVWQLSPDGNSLSITDSPEGTEDNSERRVELVRCGG